MLEAAANSPRGGSSSRRRAVAAVGVLLALACMLGIVAAPAALAAPDSIPSASPGEIPSPTAAGTESAAPSALPVSHGSPDEPAPAIGASGSTALPALPPAPTPELDAEATALLERLEASYAESERLSEDINAAQEQLDGLTRRLVDVDARTAAAQQTYDKASAALGQRARAAYMHSGSSQSLAATLRPNLLPSSGYAVGDVLRRDSSAVSKAQKARDALVELRRSRAAAVTKQQDVTAQLKAQQSELQAAADAITAELSRLSEQMLGALETVRARSTAANDATWQRFVQANGGMRAENYLSPSAAAARAVEVALAQRGDPYVWGAVGPDTFDCSGLTRYAYAAAGVSIPRVSRDQYNFGQKVPLTDLLAGDLVFYARNLSDPSTIHHVAMYIGNGSIVHAPHTGDVVRVAPVWRSGLIGATRPTLPGQRPGAPLAPPDVLNPTGTAPPVPPPVVDTPAPTTPPRAVETTPPAPPTDTPTPTDTGTATPTPTDTVTPTPTDTGTPTPTDTGTPPTPTPTDTGTTTPADTPTPTPTPTESPAATPTPTESPSPTSTSTPTSSETPTEPAPPTESPAQTPSELPDEPAVEPTSPVGTP